MASRPLPPAIPHCRPPNDRGQARQGTGARSIGRATAIAVALATILAGAITLAMAADTAHASVSWSGAWGWLTHGNPALTLPAQQTGTARGLAHYVPASAARGHRGRGYPRGRGRGQLPPFKLHGPATRTTKAKPFIGTGAHSFNPATSRPVMSKATATSTLYCNADGSYTRLVYPQPTNLKAPNGTWQPIKTTLTRTSTGRLRETANSMAISLAPNAANSTLVSVSRGQAGRVSYGLLGAAPIAASVTSSAATYSSVLPTPTCGCPPLRADLTSR